MNRKRTPSTPLIVFCLLALFVLTVQSPAEVVLQFFNNTWNEIAEKIPELAEVGYGSLWLPPPQKASGGLSVGYDLWDPFDLGNKDQRSTIKTRYGTEEELLRLIRTAHRFGMRVYFDNIMNHRAFDVPGWDENTPVDIYPGMLPEDFHLRITEDGFYRKWDNTVNWGSTWEVQHRNLSDLIDIAHETPNQNFGRNEGDWHPKISFVRHPNNPEYYDYHPTGYCGFANSTLTTNVIAENPDFFKEDVGGYLMRSVRWLMDRTKVDGLRLDAVKHVPGYFFGEQWAGDKDSSSAGYCGQAQWQFNMTRGFNDWDNHRDTVFDTEKSYGRNDAMMFGEHMGEPPGYGDYWAAGMRLLDARTHSTLNSHLGNPWGTLAGLDSADYISGVQMGAALGVYYAKSHDDNIAYREELHNVINLTRAGLPVIYTDGNRQAETLGQSGGAFPRHANTAYLGQWGDNRIPRLVHVHDMFARGYQNPVWADSDFLAYERIDKRAGGMSDASGCTMLVLVNDDYSSGQARDIRSNISFLHDGGTPDDAYLYNYSSYGGGFYTYASELHNVIVPAGGYFIFSWRTPEESDLWRWSGGKPLTIYDGNGQEAGWVGYVRRDGPDGDPGFNPYGVPDTQRTAFAYTWYVPRVTSPTNVKFVARVDGSAIHVMMKLDGGMDLNGQNHALSGDPRDYPPGNEGSYDVFLGYEHASFVSRIGPEKFGSVDSGRNKIGSPGAETYMFTVGQAGFQTNHSDGVNDWNNSHTAVFVYHDPSAQTDDSLSQFWPSPENTADQDIWFQVKTGRSGDVNRVFVYYTTDGVSWPEGAGGQGIGNTMVVELYPRTNIVEDDPPVTNIWFSENYIPAQTNGTVVRYKISAFRQQGYGGADWHVPFPVGASEVALKTKMMGTWQVTNFNPSSIVYRPHNDWGMISTGLVDGFHVIRARAFLERNNEAPLYNTFTQPFYLDTETPQGEIKYPTAGETYWQNQYGVVLRTDPTVTEVLYNFTDGSAANDDGQTGDVNGNGTNALGQTSWARAYKVTPSLSIPSDYPDEWRLTYRNIPTNGQGVLRVRLLELSSSTNMGLGAAEGHYTELARTNDTRAPAVEFFFDWPTVDGTAVEEGWTIRLKFSSSLGDGLNDEQMLDRFLITINDVAQGRSSYSVTRDTGGGVGQIEYDLPALYNGDTNFLHHIAITYLMTGGVTLQAHRYVRAQSAYSGPVVQIVDPPEYDQDGKSFEIVLPDIASPSSTQRQYKIRVETDTLAQNAWIVFTNSVGYTHRIPSVTNALSGTVSVTQGSNVVTGSGTLFDSQLGTGARLLISTNLLTVQQVLNSNSLLVTGGYPGVTASGLTAYRVDANPTASGNKQYWEFMWTNITAGNFTFIANVNTGDTSEAFVHASQTRNTRVVFRQVVNNNTNDLDDDDDGLYDEWEVSSTNLPSTNPETWVNGDVHIWRIFGKTDPLSPDTDGDDIPDGLESGWNFPLSGTETNTDTNGDGWPNFIADKDPPIYNTTDNNWHPKYNFNASRTDQLGGSMTDPSRPDTDYDGLNDGQEDLNRNGRVDIGLLSGGVVTDVVEHPDIPTVYNTSRVDRDALPANSQFLETDPNSSDTDGDSLSDGQEDINRNTRVDLALLWPAGTTTPFVVTWQTNAQYILGTNMAGIRSRALNYDKLWNDYPRPTYTGGTWHNTNTWPRLLFLETDPLTADTNDDGLPDGWKVRYGLDPLDDGWYNLRTGEIHPTNSQQGADGDLTGDGVNNLQHYLNGTDPRANTTTPPPAGAIIIGRGEEIGTINGTTYYEEFMDWTWSDLRALDYYEGAGPNNQQGDIFRGWDGWDDSRDMVAFYTRDGGSSGAGGTDKFYFRIDFYDLQALVEDANLDLYVVIDTGNQGIGERVLPDDVDTLTDMRWELVVAVYDSASGMVYVDMNPSQNTSTFSEDLFSHGGVMPQGHFFIGAYFNSELDAVEFAIDRQALLDVNWNGNPDTLNFQVFTTKDGTMNSPVGAGDIGGRSDIRDSIYNDYIAEDYWDAQGGLGGDKSVLRSWIPGNNQPSRTKVAMLIHGNQALLPGSSVQNLINNGEGAGYHRALAAHEVFRQPLNLHITPTLASAIEWARVDTNAGTPWRDGPAFNEWIAELAATNIVYLLASTFSDHMLPYFTPEFNRDNEAMAREYLEKIYGVTFTTNSVFWTPERLLDADVFDKIKDMGYQWTVLDQNTHLWWWFGRTDSLGDNGYSINRIHGVNTFAINNLPTSYRFANQDSGLNMSLRGLFNRRARGAWERVTTIFSNWEDFGNGDSADAYERNIRWMANRPWIRLVGFEEITREELDLGGGYKSWASGTVQRGTPTISKQGHDWLDHASRSNYDNWYLGDSLAEGLQNKIFDIRPGTPMPNAYGMMYTEGVITDTWEQVMSIADTNLAKLARSALHASVFQTAFHNNEEYNLSRWSTGEYIYPTAQSNAMADFAKIAQAQTRTAAIFAYADNWAATAGGLTTTVVAQADVDLDGENEYVLANSRMLGLFEGIGGRMIAAWVRDPSNGRVVQVAGNQAGYAGSETEWEGVSNADVDGNVLAYRTSCFKDWDAGTSDYVNMLYNFTPVANGWQIASVDGKITKTITLAPNTNLFNASYNVSGTLNGGVLKIRHGLSPNLYNLLMEGQRTLGYEEHAGGVMTLANNSAGLTVTARLGYQDAGHNAAFNTTAVDDSPATFYTVNMRNQVQTHQVEVFGTNTFNFSLAFTVESGLSDWEQWCEDNEINPSDPDGDEDEDDVSNWNEFIADTDPNDETDFFHVTGTSPMTPGMQFSFDSKSGRRYYIWYSNNDLLTPAWSNATPSGILGTGDSLDWTDDGSQTEPPPEEVPYRFYRIEVEKPE